ncbi:hypothetical protein [Aureimonas sp. AU22]|nr:hypothetical protein [Aureimonas sp. AU22]
MIGRVLAWIDDHARRRTPIHALATDDRIYVAVILLAIVSGILSGLYG